MKRPPRIRTTKEREKRKPVADLAMRASTAMHQMLDAYWPSGAVRKSFRPVIPPTSSSAQGSPWIAEAHAPSRASGGALVQMLLVRLI